MDRNDPGDRLTRRARILDAATEVIATQGVGASFGTIARAAGVSPALITYHFKTRDDLLFAVAAAIDDELNQVLSRAVTPEQSPGTELRSFIERFLAHARERPVAFLAARALVHGIPTDQRRDLPAIAPDRGIASVSELIVAAQSAGEAVSGSGPGSTPGSTPGSAHTLAIAVMGALEALAFHLATEPDDSAPHTAGTEHLLRLLGMS